MLTEAGRRYALEAQGIERRPAKSEAASSNLARGTTGRFESFSVSNLAPLPSPLGKHGEVFSASVFWLWGSSWVPAAGFVVRSEEVSNLARGKTGVWRSGERTCLISRRSVVQVHPFPLKRFEAYSVSNLGPLHGPMSEREAFFCLAPLGLAPLAGSRCRTRGSGVDRFKSIHSHCGRSSNVRAPGRDPGGAG